MIYQDAERIGLPVLGQWYTLTLPISRSSEISKGENVWGMGVNKNMNHVAFSSKSPGRGWFA
jgi:hypothetical protein